MCHHTCGLWTSGASSTLDHQQPGDLSLEDFTDAAEAFRNVLLVCHTNPTAVIPGCEGRSVGF